VRNANWYPSFQDCPPDTLQTLQYNDASFAAGGDAHIITAHTSTLHHRGDKFFRYRTWLPSLTDYILVAQATPLLDHFHRQPHRHWELSSASGLASSLSIDSIACTLRLADVYERIAFPPEALEAYPEEPSSA
jgi:hypothetical protein